MDLSSIVTQFSAWSETLIQTFGYFGLFFVNLISSASIFFPIPAFIFVFLLGSQLNPWLVGLSAAAGSALGELTGYGLGIGGGKIIEKKYKTFIKKHKKLFGRRFIFPVIILFAATPLPDDVVGIVCGIFKYDVKKFLIASFIGKLILNLALAFGGYYGLTWVKNVLGGFGGL